MKLTIPTPCHENWNQMSPAEQGRFCAVCSKTVKDFTAVPDEEIVNAFSQNSENVCGRFKTSQLNRDLQFSFINTLFAKFAVGFILTAGGFTAVKAQQCEPKRDSLDGEKIKGSGFAGKTGFCKADEYGGWRASNGKYKNECSFICG